MLFPCTSNGVIRKAAGTVGIAYKINPHIPQPIKHFIPIFKIGPKLKGFGKIPFLHFIELFTDFAIYPKVKGSKSKLKINPIMIVIIVIINRELLLAFDNIPTNSPIIIDVINIDRFKIIKFTKFILFVFF